MAQPPLRYPHPAGTPGHPPDRTGLHETGGINDNWALDFMAPGGTVVVAPQASTVWRLSGHDPRSGVHAGSVFGWSVYLITSPGGIIYFSTHYGRVTVKLGQHLSLGQPIGTVGHWPQDPGRSHTHIGVTHPAGKSPAIARILAVARAPRVHLPV